MSWNSELGIWKWWIFRGTTPRNAGVWTLDIVWKDRELWMGTGKHAYMTYFLGPEEKWSIEREPDDCDCYGCSGQDRVFKWTLAELEAAWKVMQRDDLPVRKLPPREPRHAPDHVCETSRCWAECHPPGCQPADCCGDPDAHL